MKVKDIIETALHLKFGASPKQALKLAVNRALDEGEYSLGFELAINKDNLDHHEYRELSESFLLAYQDNIPNLDKIAEIIDKNLLQAYYSSVSWLVSDKGEIFIADGLRVAKIFKDELFWVTRRVSYDGINLLHIEKNQVKAEWYCPYDDESQWQPLILSAIDGTLIIGKIID